MLTVKQPGLRMVQASWPLWKRRMMRRIGLCRIR
jgi:hypothetical protein